MKSYLQTIQITNLSNLYILILKPSKFTIPTKYDKLVSVPAVYMFSLVLCLCSSI